MRIHIRVQWGIAMGTSVRQSEAENFHVAVMKTEDARIRGNCGCTCRSQHGSASVVASLVPFLFVLAATLVSCFSAPGYWTPDPLPLAPG